MSAAKAAVSRPAFTKFSQAFLKGDVFVQVRAVEPEARSLIRTGIDTDAHVELARTLTGKQVQPHPEDWNAYCEQLGALYALGIAVGLLLRPDTVHPAV